MGDHCLTRRTPSDPGRGKTSEVPLSISGEARSLRVLVTAIALATYKENTAEEQAAVKEKLPHTLDILMLPKGARSCFLKGGGLGRPRQLGCGGKSKNRPVN